MLLSTSVDTNNQTNMHTVSEFYSDIRQQIVPKLRGLTRLKPSVQSMFYRFFTTPIVNTPNHIQPDQEKKVQANTKRIGVSENRPKIGTKRSLKRISKRRFEPMHPSRAHLNIFTSKELTKALLSMIVEQFDDNLMLYYYTDISTALQMNDAQMNVFVIENLDNCSTEQVCIINYDLHCKQTNECLYGVVIPNDSYSKERKSDTDGKWLWKLDCFMLAKDIELFYGITADELPRSSRNRESFKVLLREQPVIITEQLIGNTDWFSVQQIKSLKRGQKVPRVSVSVSSDLWKKECRKSFQNMDTPLIPVVVNKNGIHWVEWIKIVHIESQDICIGISCKYEENKWSVTAICLDKGDIYNKHRLIGYKDEKYLMQLRPFTTSISEIKFSDNDTNDVDKKKEISLKQQIKHQQESILRLKEALMREKNSTYYVAPIQKEHHTQYKQQESIKQHIKEMRIDLEDEKGAEWMNDIDELINHVTKPYDVHIFSLNPVGAKKNIFIDKHLTKSWMACVTPRFKVCPLKLRHDHSLSDLS